MSVSRTAISSVFFSDLEKVKSSYSGNTILMVFRNDPGRQEEKQQPGQLACKIYFNPQKKGR